MLNNIYLDINKDSKKKNYIKANKKSLSSDGTDFNHISTDENIFSQIYKKLKIWYESITFVVQHIVAISIILWILDLFFINNITYLFANVPFYTINNFQIWRLITSNLITSNIFSLIFALIFWVSDGKVVEKMKGSVKYLIYFLIHSTIIQLLYALIYFLFLKNNTVEKNSINSNGLWPYIICEVTINCLISPENEIFLPFIPYGIKSKFFPIIILLIFFIFGGFEISIFISVIYGFIYSFLLSKYLEISDDKIINIENKCFKYFYKYKSFIKFEDICNKDNERPFIPDFIKYNIDNNKDYGNENYESDSNSEDSHSNNNNNIFNKKLKKFVPFSGKGIKLGN